MRHTKVALLGGLLMMTGACTDRLPPTSPESVPGARTAQAALPGDTAGELADDLSRSHEIPSTRAARRVRGFGGFTFDPAGNLVLMMQDPANVHAINAAREVLRPHLSAERGGRSPRVMDAPPIVRKAEFSFSELRRLRDKHVDDILTVRGALFVDLDEGANRVVIGVDSARFGAVREEVLSILRARSAKLDPVQFVASQPIYCAPDSMECDPCTYDPASCEPDPEPDPDPCTVDPSSTECVGYPCAVIGGEASCGSTQMSAANNSLIDPVVPLIAGTRVSRPDSWGSPLYGTLGFSVYYCPPFDVDSAGRCGYYWVVTAHQTPNIAVWDGVTFYQPAQNAGGTTLGRERYDPPWHRTAFAINPYQRPDLPKNCQPYDNNRQSIVCRRSDMALIWMEGTYGFHFGRLAKPKNRIMGPGVFHPEYQFAMNPSDYTMPILGEQVMYEYEFVDHIGSTTGWRPGQVTRTCLDIAQTPSTERIVTYVLRCQTQVQWDEIEQGDSGGPVFKWSGTGAYLAGIVWSTNAANLGYYTPLANIRNDLGLTYTDTHNFKTYGTAPQ